MGTRKNRLTEAVLTCTTINVFSKNKKNIKIFHLKIIFFYIREKLKYYHGHISVMRSFLLLWVLMCLGKVALCIVAQSGPFI